MNSAEAQPNLSNVKPVDDDDTDYSRGLSFQPNLLWLTKKICEVLGYTY